MSIFLGPICGFVGVTDVSLVVSKMFRLVNNVLEDCKVRGLLKILRISDDRNHLAK